MNPSDVPSTGGTAEQQGHNYVSGTATVRPGTWREPGQPAPAPSGGTWEEVSNRAEELAATAGQHPWGLFLAGVGLGFLLGRAWRS